MLVPVMLSDHIAYAASRRLPSGRILSCALKARHGIVIEVLAALRVLERALSVCSVAVLDGQVVLDAALEAVLFVPGIVAGPCGVVRLSAAAVEAEAFARPAYVALGDDLAAGAGGSGMAALSGFRDVAVRVVEVPYVAYIGDCGASPQSLREGSYRRLKRRYDRLYSTGLAALRRLIPGRELSLGASRSGFQLRSHWNRNTVPDTVLGRATGLFASSTVLAANTIGAHGCAPSTHPVRRTGTSWMTRLRSGLLAAIPGAKKQPGLLTLQATLVPDSSRSQRSQERLFGSANREC